jgi:tRNA pseudouridine32 synthase/23S rRNA pseudouridine746 synthase
MLPATAPSDPADPHAHPSSATGGVVLVRLTPQWVAADKPAGLLCVPGRGPGGADCLAARVQAAVPDALVVHRLDMATSGLVLFGRGPAAQRMLSVGFAERRMHKRYVAVVQGRVAGAAGTVDLPLAADWPNRPRQQVCLRTGKPSLTRWRLLAHEGDRSRLLLEPVTGRSHQLRVHLLAIGHPILGDTLYAPPAVAAAAPRLLLHASHLAWEDAAGRHALDSAVPF